MVLSFKERLEALLEALEASRCTGELPEELSRELSFLEGEAKQKEPALKRLYEEEAAREGRFETKKLLLLGSGRRRGTPVSSSTEGFLLHVETSLDVHLRLALYEEEGLLVLTEERCAVPADGKAVFSESGTEASNGRWRARLDAEEQLFCWLDEVTEPRLYLEGVKALFPMGEGFLLFLKDEALYLSFGGAHA